VFGELLKSKKSFGRAFHQKHGTKHTLIIAYVEPIFEEKNQAEEKKKKN